MKKRGIIIIFFVLVCILIIFMYFFLKETPIEETGGKGTENQEFSTEIKSPSEKNDVVKYNEDGSVTLPEGYTANGFYDIETNKIIDSRTTIHISGDVLQGRVSFQQNFPTERNYLLIVLIDYMQHDFFVENNSYQSYPFKLEGESEFNLDISIELAESEGREFSYIIVSEPDEKEFLADGEYDWDTMFFLREPVINRFNLDRLPSQSEANQENQQDFMEFQAEGNISGFELVKSREQLTAFVDGKSGEMTELVILNQEQDAEEKKYVILGFSGWKQVPLNGTNMKYYVTVPANTSVSIPVILPEVKEPAVFQVIAISEPDTVLNVENIKQDPSSFRVLVNP